MEDLLEIQSFMSIGARLDLKSVAVSDVLNLTGSPDGRALIYKCPKVVHSLFCLTLDTEKSIAKEAVLALVNISADEAGAAILLDETLNLVSMCVRFILDDDCPIADAWSMVLSNISRPEALVERVVDELLRPAADANVAASTLHALVTCFTRIDYNKHKCHLNYLGPIFSNVSQTSRCRALFCNPDDGGDLLLRLLPFVQHDSTIRRGGCIGLLKNVCFDSARHAWLLSAAVNVLPYLLLPLAGGEEFSDEDNEMFPTELQYLDEEKQRERDPDLRKILLESLAQLCATRSARDVLRERGTYEILRELHKFECGTNGDAQALRACENVVDVLIRTEEEIGEDNLKELEIPGEMAAKFEQELVEVEGQ